MMENVYAVERIAAARLEDLRAAAARIALIESGRVGRRGWGRVVGAALVRFGRWLAGGGGAEAANAGVRVAR
ncbi:MAG TPA: hypothetical protein VLK28_12085 [Methylomirabilota bacterium]|nr:hypothetical protein [Methylomirabilota bacterium]